NPTAGRDQPSASNHIGEPTRQELAGTPHRWIDRGEYADTIQSEAGRRIDDWKESPSHAVIEVVDEPGLTDCREIRIGEGGSGEDRARRQRRASVSPGRMRVHLMPRMSTGFTYKQRRQHEASARVDHPWIERLGANCTPARE